MVDGYKLVEVFTRSTTDHDIRRLHTVFCSEMTVDLTLLLILEEEKKRRRGPAPGYLADGTPTKDIFTRLDKLEIPLNDPQNQETFFRQRHVIVYKFVSKCSCFVSLCRFQSILLQLEYIADRSNSRARAPVPTLLERAMTPKVVRNAWEAPGELDLRPYVAAAKERIIETVAAVVCWLTGSMLQWLPNACERISTHLFHRMMCLEAAEPDSPLPVVWDSAAMFSPGRSTLALHCPTKSSDEPSYCLESYCFEYCCCCCCC